MSDAKFVHLSMHTEFSLTDSLVKIKPLMKALKENGHKAVGISDTTNMFAAIRFYKQALANGIKPIISSEITLSMPENEGNIILICRNEVGYQNLIRLVSRAYEEGFTSDSEPARIDFEWLKESSEGLIALSGARYGNIGKALLSGNSGLADTLIERMKGLFGSNFFLEIQRTGNHDDERQLQQAVRRAVRHDVPVVATNAVRFLQPKDHKSHQIRACVSRNMTLQEFESVHKNLYTPEQFLKSPEEMVELFSDIPSATANSVAIAEMCSVTIELDNPKLPKFPCPNNMTEDGFLASESRKGLDERLAIEFKGQDVVINSERKKYDDRLNYELGIITEMGFAGYFLIVADFIRWSKENGVPVGPGRGSGAGSLIAYALKITDLDPLKYDLLFERFLNPERVSMPDFDVDFCMDGRDRAIKYVSDKYGKQSVSQIVTFGTMAAKSVVRDVARVLGQPYRLGNNISKMIPGKPGTTLVDTLQSSVELQNYRDENQDVREILEHALTLEGTTRQTGKHAGGVLISPSLLTDFTPTINDGSGLLSQFDKDDVESSGLVKFDFLGLKTLTIIDNAVKAVNVERQKRGEDPLEILQIPLDDEKTFELYQRGDTTAVFQVESKGMKDLNKKLRPDCFEDIIALVALFRPGPIESGMVQNFIDRKHGREEVSYPDPNYQHELLKPILEPTYGIILYQEQVMQIAQTLAGYTLGGADLLRRAMGKKKPEEMEKQRAIFAEGAKQQGIDENLATKIFDLVEKFAGYGFNKSHSAAYALVSYQTAWLKTHYPAQYMAAVLSSEMSNTDKIVSFIHECKEMGLTIEPPSINKSERYFVARGNTITYGLEAVKGLGDSAVDIILKKRKEAEQYKSLVDFCRRASPKNTTLKAGICAGIFDEFGYSRATLMANFPKAAEIGKQERLTEAKHQDDLFGSVSEDQDAIRFDEAEPWTDRYRLGKEQETLGLFLTGHPLDEFEDEIENLITGKLIDLTETTLEAETEVAVDADDDTAPAQKPGKWVDKVVTVAGHIVSSEIRLNKGGQTAFLTIDDKSRQIEVLIFNKFFEECQHFIDAGETVVIKGRLTRDRKTGNFKILGFDVKTMDLVRENSVSHVRLSLTPDNMSPDHQARLKTILENQKKGDSKVVAHYSNGRIEKEVSLGDYRIKVTDELVHMLGHLFGKDAVDVVYKTSSKDGKSPTKAVKDSRTLRREAGEKTRKERYERIARLFDEVDTLYKLG